jgi:hypothetical protein
MFEQYMRKRRSKEGHACLDESRSVHHNGGKSINCRGSDDYVWAFHAEDESGEN